MADALLERALALPSQDGDSFPLHPVVRATVLVVLSQLAPLAGRQRGLDLLPVTPAPGVLRDLVALLGLPGLAPAGHVVALDAEAVGLDLSDAPLEAVLEFRGLHGGAYRRYIRNVRTFVRELSGLESQEERDTAVLDRQEELTDSAADLKRVARTYWRRPLARVAVGGVGAVLSLAADSVLPAALAGMAALLEWDSRPDEAGPFTYLFEVHRSLHAY